MKEQINKLYRKVKLYLYRKAKHLTPILTVVLLVGKISITYLHLIGDIQALSQGVI